LEDLLGKVKIFVEAIYLSWGVFGGFPWHKRQQKSVSDIFRRSATDISGSYWNKFPILKPIAESELDRPINMGDFLIVKTTLEFPDSLFRRAKSTAARKGQTMTAFVTSAVEAKLTADETAANEKPWMQFAGLLEKDRKESSRILKRIEESCEQVIPEDWE